MFQASNAISSHCPAAGERIDIRPQSCLRAFETRDVQLGFVDAAGCRENSERDSPRRSLRTALAAAISPLLAKAS
jgi:hypothetical protein